MNDRDMKTEETLSTGPGRLYLVASPIGDMEDITLRALRVLREVEIIASEDTRKTLRLMAFHGIKPGGRLVSCHEHNEEARTAELLGKLGDGKSVALITDAGTPLVSDPGFRLVRSAIAKGFKVVPVPGASASLAALSASGLPTDRFFFAGFLPKKRGDRLSRLNELAGQTATMIFYESPQRVTAFLKELAQALGERRAVVCREITKTHEEFIRGTLSGLAQELESRKTVKGEITLVVEGADKKTGSFNRADFEQEVGKAKCGTSELAGMLAKKYGMPRRMIYSEILRLKEKKRRG